MRFGKALGHRCLVHLRLQRPQLLDEACCRDRALAAGPLFQEVEALQKPDLPQLQLLCLIVALHGHGRLLLRLDLLQLLSDGPALRRCLAVLGLGDLLPDFRAGLVHHIDGLVWKEAVRNVLRGQLDCGHQGLRGVPQLVVLLVFGRQTLQDLYSLILAGLGYGDWLEAPLQGRVALDVLAVLVQRRGPDALQLPACEGGLQQICRIDATAVRTASTACTHECVDLVDHEDHRSLALCHLLHNGTQALLEVAAIARSGQKQGKVELHHPLV
mmetsp:Transcript_96585/g.268470  ORF Transcript_96585/g.268470 Transcript_96585/m.268470 type:complete len:271 (-) Transcript_96585:1480-2292(-)